MIPTFNCASYLKQTLESVLAQDPGPGEMQIEVVDDCSTKDDPEAVVREIGKGRVDFYRKPKNEGAIQNFNTCIERSRGYLVHILHGDDYVLPGFYKKVEEYSDMYPDVAGFFTRCFIVDENNELEDLSPRIPTLEIPEKSPRELLYTNKIYTPTAVLRRKFYEKYGAFLPPLINVADWEMWIRCIRYGGAVMLNQALASYRRFPGNDSSRVARSAENVRDNLRLCAILNDSNSDFNYSEFLNNVIGLAHYQKEKFDRLGDIDAAFANLRIWEELVPKSSFNKRLRYITGSIYYSLKRR